MEPEEKKQISLYADQPTGVVQGLRHAYSSLARDLNVARDAVIAVPGELMERGAARTVMSRAPTIIFRPAIGATRAVGQALMGATNALDPENLRRAEDVGVIPSPTVKVPCAKSFTEIQARARSIVETEASRYVYEKRVTHKFMERREEGYVLHKDGIRRLTDRVTPCGRNARHVKEVKRGPSSTSIVAFHLP